MIKNPSCKNDTSLSPKLKLLPHSFKKIGYVLAALSFVALFSARYIPESTEIIRIVARKGLLISLFLVAISRDQIEDELTSQLRKQAFSFAFIWGVILALIQPYITYVIALWLKPGRAYAESTSFEILLFFLVFHLMYFEVFKRKR